ncbi:MAG: replication initiator protein [Microviridae sp.]|nr:MAG: replication initiator protein [Microviridae sp.]
MHEASLHDANCSLTLTYSDEFLPVNGSLVPYDTQCFIKRVRKHFGPSRLSFFLCGEYGGAFGRAHYHVLLFGVWFGDSQEFKKSQSGAQLYRSVALDKLWGLGHADIGTLTFESAAYAARYVVEKINGDAAVEHYRGRVPEFVRMSLRPAIGRRWFERFRDDVYPSDTVVVRGHESRPPLYYDKLLGRSEGSLLEEAKAKRASEALKSLPNRSIRRLAVREEVARARLGLYKK